MVEKRKRYMALRESTSAKRRSPSPTRVTETPEVPVRSLTPDVPTTFAKDGPLPVLPGQQATDLLLKDYKSVAESKVMLESLERSRRKWVDGDIFEKFWIKPLKSRKLDPAELEKNPSKDCMARLGNATLSCKPHKFEIRLFGVLEHMKVPLTSPQPPQGPQSPAQLQQLPLSAPMATVPRPQYAMDNQQQGLPHPDNTVQPANSYAPPVQSATTPAQALVAPQASTPGPPGNVAAPAFHIPAQTPSHHPQHLHPQQQHPQPYPHPQQQHLQHPHPQHPGNANMQPGLPPRPDPVIQSLAVRAASDPDLKALMRIVASGKATTEQLRIFQGHIDALTPASCPPIVPTAGRAKPLAPVQGSVGAQAQARPQPTQQLHPQHLQHPQHIQHQQINHHSQYVQHPQYSQQQSQMQPHRPVQQPAQAPPKPRPFPQPPKQEINSVVFEFTDQFSQGDRFIFPKYTILEYAKNGMMVTASFMITRKPIDDLDEYYQPVTIILEATNPRTLEALQKVVADQETTCNHMKRLMSTLKRADDSFLVFRLRRDPNEVVPDKRDVIEAPPRAARESRVRRETSTPVRDSKGTPGDMAQSLLPSRPRVKTVKKALPKEPPQAAATTSNINHTYPTSSACASAPALPPTIPRTPHPKPPKPPRSRKGRIADPTKSCSICKTSKTSLWRKADIEGKNVTVCNACGIKWKTNTQRAAQVAAAAVTGQPLPRSRENSMSGGQRPTLQQMTSGEPVMQFHRLPLGVGGRVYPQASFPQQQLDGFQAGSSGTREVVQNEVIETTVIVKGGSVVDSATSSIVASHVAAHSAQPPQPQPQVQAAAGDPGDGMGPMIES